LLGALALAWGVAIWLARRITAPLARMRLALEMLKTPPTPSLISRLECDIEEINGLIANLLDLARSMERGLSRETPTAVNLAAWLTALGADFSTPQHPIVVSCAPGQCALPPNTLRRALGNLLQNAQRHAPDGTVELVGTRDVAGCTLSVLDRGPGIPSERIEVMFEPFVRLDASRCPQGGGAGLGLAIVRELARANGWQVTLDNRDGGGLAAHITIPAQG
jgi:two-component system osmolarity sensor histidine kinase EnvZ